MSKITKECSKRLVEQSMCRTYLFPQDFKFLAISAVLNGLFHRVNTILYRLDGFLD